MPYDSNGNASLVPSYFVQDGDDVLPVQHNPPLEDIAAMLSMALIRDGRAPMSGNLNMGGNKVTNLATPTNPNDAARLQDLDRDRPCFFAIKTANQSLSTAAVLAFNDEKVDEGSYYDPATYRWTPPAGIYEVTLSCQLHTSNTPSGLGPNGEVYALSTSYAGTIAIRKNGTIISSARAEIWTNPSEYAHATVVAIVEMNGTDYIDAWGSGTAVSVFASIPGGWNAASTFSGKTV